MEDMDTREWWSACARREYVIQRCMHCGRHRYPPKPICYNCQSLEFEWQRLSGRGVIYSYEMVVHPVHSSLAKRGPYIVVLVELPDASNERVIGNLLGAEPEDVAIGKEVALEWEDIGNGINLPQWRLI